MLKQPSVSEQRTLKKFNFVDFGTFASGHLERISITAKAIPLALYT